MFFMSGTSYLLAQSAVTGRVTDENGDGNVISIQNIPDGTTVCNVEKTWNTIFIYCH